MFDANYMARVSRMYAQGVNFKIKAADILQSSAVLK